MIALFAALKAEIASLPRGMGLQPYSIRGFRGPIHAGTYRGQAILLAVTGMGRRRAEAAVRAVLENAPVKMVFSIGFSGALSAALSPGDVVVPHTLLAQHTGDATTDLRACHPDPALLETITDTLGALQLRWETGQTVTTPIIIGTPEARQALQQRTGAIAVDMESYWIARMAAASGLPFLAVRAISDASQDVLPSGEILNSDGSLRVRQLTVVSAQLLRNPRLLLTVLRHSRQAQRTLATAITAIPWQGDAVNARLERQR